MDQRSAGADPEQCPQHTGGHLPGTVHPAEKQIEKHGGGKDHARRRLPLRDALGRKYDGMIGQYRKQKEEKGE